MKFTHCFVLLFSFFSINIFSQPVNFTRLSGPEGGYIERFGINEQGDILASYIGGMTTHISRDGGDSWSTVSGNFGTLSLAGHPDGSFYGYGFSVPPLYLPNIINKISSGTNFVQNIPGEDLITSTANFTVDKDGVFFAINANEEIIRSDDNLLTWTNLGTVPWKGAGFYFLELYAPENSDYIYVDYRQFSPSANRLYRMKKDGSEFEIVYEQTASISNFAHHPDVGHFISTGSNVLYSSDGSSGSWQSISSGFEVLWIAVAPNGDLTAAGRDGYFRSNNLGGNWTSLPGNSVTVHPDGLEIQYNPVYDRYIIENLSSATNNLFSVSPDFKNWKPINPKNDRPPISKVFVDGADNIYAAVLRPNEIEVEGYHRSSDGGNTYQPLLLPNNVEIRSISGGANDVLFAMGYDEQLYKSVDFGLTWTVVSVPVFVTPNNTIRYSFVKGHINGTIVAHFQTGSATLWLSSDNGDTWNPIDNFRYYEEDLDIHPNGDVYAISFDAFTVLRQYEVSAQQWKNIRIDPSSASRVDISPEGVIFTNGTYRGLRGTLISEDNGATFAGTSVALNYLEAGPNGILVGTTQAAGNIFLSRNNGLSWEIVYQYGGGFGPGTIREFFFDKNNRLYIAINGDFIHKSDPFVFNDNYIVGNVFYDADESCDFNAGENPMPNILLTCDSGTDTFYVTTREDGFFSIPVPAGSYQVAVQLDDDYWEACDLVQTANLTGINDTFFIDFPAKALVQCPKMQVDLTNPFLRRCFDNTYHVRYCNEGSTTGTNASIEVTLDSRMEIISSTRTWSLLGDTYTFALGDVPINVCERFSFVTQMECDSVDLGETLCAEARVFPDTICIPPDPTWNGASLAIEGECLGDSILFEITNVGTGDMLQARQYIIIEDEVVERVSPPFMLDVNEPLPVKIETMGQTFHIETQQVDNHPGNSKPRLTVEKCGTAPFSYGFFNQFGQDDLSGMLDIECREAIGSFDPNDKSAVPRGIDSDHKIQPESTIEYLIRFQNTGTDTAFNIAIIDTISNLLDISTLEVGASSHDYEYKMLDQGILRFDFKNIMLPDSNINLVGSNGFVKYKITLKPDAPLGATIYNAADIYFDFNDPIYTNQTFHLIDQPWSLVTTTEVFDENLEVKVFPNPFQNQAIFELKNASNLSKRFLLFSNMGSILRNQTFEGSQFEIERGDLPRGVYFYEVLEGNRKIVVGKIVVE